jgi:S1-C subfamily serine protease
MSGEQSFGTVKTSHRDNSLWAIVIIFMIMNVGIVSYFTYFRSSAPSTELSTLTTEVDNLKFQLNSAQLEINDLKDQIKTVGISNQTDSLILTQLYNMTRKSVVLIDVTLQTGEGIGSGFVYDDQGRIVTNYHVVDGATSIQVTFIDGTQLPAKLLGTDPYSDMAVIQVNAPKSLLHPVRFGNSSDLLVGTYVVAIGNPFGLANTMTLGIVSATGRTAQAPGNYVIVDVIQTDAAINPGNSGGPLLDLKGEVVGMNSYIQSNTGGFTGIGFAIPSDTIDREVESLIQNGTYEHALIGISGVDMSPGIASSMGLDNSTRGTLVITVTPGGPADAAGIKGGNRQVTVNGQTISVGGDVVIGADGRTMKTFYDLMLYVDRNKHPGDVVTLTIIRDGKVMDVNMTLGVRPAP